ncbi:MAG: isochorismatase family protein [Proteobacteria bacterium]|nr:isochorismatase family protein [Pseudomonadota bacterium]
MKIPSKEFVASFDVHAQKTFTPLCPGELPIVEGDQIAQELNRQAQKAKFRIGSKEAHSRQAIWVTNHTHPILSPVPGDNVDVHWPPHSIPGTKGFELIDGLPAITDYDFFIWEGIELDMHPYGACYHDLAEKLSTGVIEFLRQKKVNTVIVGGLATDYCVKTTALQLLRANFQVVLNLAACRGLNPETIQIALDTLQKAGAKIVSGSEAVVNSIM